MYLKRWKSTSQKPKIAGQTRNGSYIYGIPCSVRERYPNSFRWNLIHSSCLVRNSARGSECRGTQQQKDRALQPDQGSHLLAAQLTQHYKSNSDKIVENSMSCNSTFLGRKNVIFNYDIGGLLYAFTFLKYSFSQRQEPSFYSKIKPMKSDISRVKTNCFM